MFKLQRLEITGFKSFADYTEIVFTGNGITAVVGPNGCGKSNVSDCISWVLGEQRAKSLRGGEMKDVIFQGSRNRKPGGMAEVVLHLVRDEDATDPDEEELLGIDEALSEIDEGFVDLSALEPIEEPLETIDAVILPESAIGSNGFHDAAEQESALEVARAAQAGSVQTVERAVKSKRHWRPRSVALDFAPGEAVSVTRRLYLSGESEYMLNGRQCRLRDIQDLFAGTGLSGAHYAIVEQGRIGQILSAKPSDRRSLIEEAAGISKFRTRQRAAESRLESAKTNLSRISDIVSEIDKQANSLRRQAGKTRRFIALQEEFRGRLRELFAAEGRHYTFLIEELSKELEQAAARETELAASVSEREGIFREATEHAREAEESLAHVRRQHSENALNRDRADREHRYKSEQLTALNERLDSIGRENLAIEERIKLAEAEIERLKKEEEREVSEADASKATLSEAEARWSEKISAVRSVEERLEGVRSELMRHTAALERFSELRRQLDLNAERLAERRAGLGKERDRVEQSITEHQDEATRLTAELAAERQKLETLNAEKIQVQSASTEARNELKAGEDALREIRDELSRKKNRLETLHELEDRRAVYFPEVQKLFAEEEKIGVKLIGVLADFLSVQEDAETAVETLFGPGLQTVLVNDAADARKLNEWVVNNRVGRVSVLAVGGASLIGAKPVINETADRLGGLIGAGEELQKILQSVFPREMFAILVDDVYSAATDGADVLVDIAGQLSQGGKLFVSGSPATDGKNTSLLAFKRELKVLDKAVEKLSSKMETAEASVEQKRQKLAEQEEKMVDLQSLIIKVERGLVGLELQDKANQQEIERANRHRTVVLAEIEQLAAEAEQLKERLAEAISGRESAESFRLEVSKQAETITKELNDARAEAEAEASVVNERRTRAATSAERRRSVQFAIRRLENERDDLSNRIGSQGLESVEISEKIKVLTLSIDEIAGKIASSAEEMVAEQEQLDEALDRLRTAREAADAASVDLAELNRRAAEAINARSSVEVRQTEALTELRNLNEKCQQELNISMPQLVDEQAVDPEFDLESARSTVEDQRQRLEGFGAINMLAVEELTEAEERLDFLTSQRQDIIDSIESTEEALREIKVRSRARFKEAFEAVNSNFTQFFSELFGGGRGEMTLLESDDILEAGIEIVAQPPGKRLQNILLLSGGEKAMTAIALVLAIFRYRPSPFCLLDEVDAPLDDANVGRFVTKIAEMSERTQFIVITHNKRTMEAARALYGVTMEEPGVSKVVSVKFD